MFSNSHKSSKSLKITLSVKMKSFQKIKQQCKNNKWAKILSFASFLEKMFAAKKKI